MIWAGPGHALVRGNAAVPAGGSAQTAEPVTLEHLVLGTMSRAAATHPGTAVAR